MGGEKNSHSTLRFPANQGEVRGREPFWNTRPPHSVPQRQMSPDKIDRAYVRELAGFLRKLSEKHELAVVVGGGAKARKEIKKLREAGKNEGLCDLAGIKVARENAEVLRRGLGKLAADSGRTPPVYPE